MVDNERYVPGEVAAAPADQQVQNLVGLEVAAVIGVVHSSHTHPEFTLDQGGTVGGLAVLAIVVRDRALQIAAGLIKAGPGGNHVDRAARRCAALQESLGATQNLYPLQVIHLLEGDILAHNRIITASGYRSEARPMGPSLLQRDLIPRD